MRNKKIPRQKIVTNFGSCSNKVPCISMERDVRILMDLLSGIEARLFSADLAETSC